MRNDLKNIMDLFRDRQNIRRSLVLMCSVFLLMLTVCSCKRYEPLASGGDMTPESQTTEEDTSPVETETTEPESETEPEFIDTRTPVKVKALYLASKPVGNNERMDEIIKVLDETELNAVVIDIKDDYGKVTYAMDLPYLSELESIEVAVEDMSSLLKKLKEHEIYCIGRIVTMRDPHLGRVKPEWMLTKQDGTLYKDNSGYGWVNPYKEEYWDYILGIALQAGKDGFDEIQFDYIRFCTDKGADDCIFEEKDVKGRDKTTVISELCSYLSENIRNAGLYMSCDVFGTIIGSKLDSRAVGQDYPAMAMSVDYICPMIYPSHYGNGNFGIDHPDLEPYKAILGACKRSKNALSSYLSEGERVAVVRPWLQAFTATWLGKGNYMTYDKNAIRQEIQAVYDAGYDEWILWNPSVKYDYSGFLTKTQGEEEAKRIEESRAAIPEEELTEAAETFPVELEEALKDGELSGEDESILLEDGPIITYE